MNWIAVSVGIMDDSEMDAIANDCGVRVAEAVGCVVGVLTRLPDEARDGNLSTKSDRALERWAEWEGKPGRFAAAFRRHLCTADGLVRSWEKYNGAAIRRSDYDRQRKADARQKAAESPVEIPEKSYGSPTDSPADSPADIQRTVQRKSVVDGTGRDITASFSPKKTERDGVRGNAAPLVSDRVFAEISPSVGAAGHDALRSLLSTVSQPETWAGIIRGCATGQSMPEARPASAERLAAAVQDFVAGGHHQSPTALTKLFRGYVANAKASPAQSRQWLNVDEDKADELRTLREQNERRRKRQEPLKPIPTWAAEIDAKFPDGRTWPVGVAS